MIKPRLVYFDQLDKNARHGTGALPIIFAILAFLSFFFVPLTIEGIATGIVRCAILLALSAIVRSIRNIEAYTIYAASVQQYALRSTPSSPAPEDSSKEYLD